MTIPNPPLGTYVPAVLDALMAGFDGVTDPTVPVLDGLPPQWPKSDAVAVAVAVPGTPGVLAAYDQDTRTLGYHESIDVTCAVWSWGDADSTQKDVRDRCKVLFDALKSWLDAHRTLDGMVLNVTLGRSVAWVPKNRGDGAECTVGFTVHVAMSI